MNILLTGGAGYLGSVLTPHLLRAGHRVTVLDNFLYDQISLLNVCHDDKLTIVHGDVRNHALMRTLLRDVDLILPFACLTGMSVCDRFPEEAREIILDSIHTVLLYRSRDQRIIYPTTNSGHGVGQEGMYCTEDTPLRPISLYGRLKVAAEELILDAGNAVSLRLATVFGVSSRLRLDLLVNDFVYTAYHKKYLELFEPHFKRNYIHILDVARAVLHTIQQFDRMNGEAYNLGLSDANLSKQELCAEIQKHIADFVYKENAEGKDPDQRNYIVSNKKIERAGFVPLFSLQDGITELIKAFQIITVTPENRKMFYNV